jgi:uncharacterized protein
MIIYQDTVEQFVLDVRHNRLTNIMAAHFFNRFGRRPGLAEEASWQNSMPRVKDVIEVAELKENFICLEYEVPYNQCRIDCLLFGKGLNEEANVVLIELKQWTKVIPLEEEGNFEEKYEVETFTGGGSKIVAHPSQQVKGYENYLKGFVVEFEQKPPLAIFSCAYCHNYSRNSDDGLFNPIYQKIVDEFPIYTREDVVKLGNRIKQLLAKGNGFEVFNRFMNSPLRPSKKLLDNVARIVNNEVVFSLLNEQIVAKNLIWAKVKRAEKEKEKSVIIVHGGPGTGKSVIAINILADAAKKGKKIFYGCKSKPFLEGLKKLVGKDGELLFSNLYRFLPNKVKENELDLLLIDEAHRIETNGIHRFMKAEDRTDMPQVDQLIRCAKTAVFFIDDKQNVRSQEIGNSNLIKESAERMNTAISESTLLTQYRCMGSNDYLVWLEGILGYTDDKKILSKNEIFDFQIIASPEEMYSIILKRELEKANSARMIAGFCWPWSKSLNSEGQFIKDVVIGDFAMPWETHGEITRPPKGYVKWYEWAYRPEGVKQIGCIYTAQGFEFDYAGVIIGDDLVYDKKTDSLKADIRATRDPTLKRSKQNFEMYVKNIYRTLLTRGMKGCYVYFTNKDTENYFRRFLGKKNRV